MALDSESLTYWYFRLNGFFTIPNFIVHPDRGALQRTDVDVLGIRLPNRRELLHDPMEDDVVFTRIADRAFVVIAEVKRDRIAFNRTWTDPNLQNVQRFLYACGAFPRAVVDGAAESIYARGCYTGDEVFHVSLVGIGRRENQTLRRQYPSVPQITWDHIGRFIFSRFHRYRDQKSRHDQWDDAGKELWDTWLRFVDDEQQFCAALAQIPQM
jgi:hypothetical protein